MHSLPNNFHPFMIRVFYTYFFKPKNKHVLIACLLLYYCGFLSNASLSPINYLCLFAAVDTFEDALYPQCSPLSLKYSNMTFDNETPLNCCTWSLCTIFDWLFHFLFLSSLCLPFAMKTVAEECHKSINLNLLYNIQIQQFFFT